MHFSLFQGGILLGFSILGALDLANFEIFRKMLSKMH